MIIAKILHQQLALKFHFLAHTQSPLNWYTPEVVLEKSEALLYWDRPIITDERVDYIRLDLVVIYKTTN